MTKSTGFISPRENLLAAIQFGTPEYVPMACEPVWYSFQFSGNFRITDWQDTWGVRWEVGLPDTVPFPKGNPLPDLDRLSDYRFPTPDALEFTDEMRIALAQVDRGRQLVKGELTYLLFERAWATMGMENCLAAFITHPREMHTFLHHIATYARGVFDRYLELGVDAIGFSEDLGSQRALMISTNMFRDFVLPEYVYCFESVLRAGKLVCFHSCGCVQSVVSDLANIGVSVLNPIQARANDLQAIKKAALGSMALDGGIDTAILADGSPEDVRREVQRVMEILKPGGGYICGPDQSIPGIPEQNTQALWNSAREFGKY